MHSSAFFAFVTVSLGATLVSSHGVPTEVTGFNGVNQLAVGADTSVPRDGALPKPFEGDTSIIRDNEIASGKAGPCGRTALGGSTDVAKAMDDAMSANGGTLPTASSSGEVQMTLHQVNQDGAGPYSCDVSTDATGKSFQEMTMTSNVPGFSSLSLATAQNFTLAAQMPDGATCTGGPNGNACLVRCRNAAVAGPFGGCAIVQNSDGSDSDPVPSAGTDATKAGADAGGIGALLGGAGGGAGGLGSLLGGAGGAAGAGGAKKAGAGGAAGGAGGIGALLGGIIRRVTEATLESQLTAISTQATTNNNAETAQLATQAVDVVKTGDINNAAVLIQQLPDSVTTEDPKLTSMIDQAITETITQAVAAAGATASKKRSVGGLVRRVSEATLESQLAAISTQATTNNNAETAQLATQAAGVAKTGDINNAAVLIQQLPDSVTTEDPKLTSMIDQAITETITQAVAAAGAGAATSGATTAGATKPKKRMIRSRFVGSLSGDWL